MGGATVGELWDEKRVARIPPYNCSMKESKGWLLLGMMMIFLVVALLSRRIAGHVSELHKIFVRKDEVSHEVAMRATHEQRELMRSRLGGWGLPLDLDERLNQLEELELSGVNVDRVEWLRAAKHLRSLTLDGSRIRSVKGLPSGLQFLEVHGEDRPITGMEELLFLQSLKLHDTQISKTGQLPGGLQSLELENTEIANSAYLPRGLQALIGGVASLEGLPPGLRSLHLSLPIGSGSLAVFPRGLQKLVVANAEVANLEGLPSGLRSLDISSTCLTSLEGLPLGLESLRISDAPLTSLEGLPRGLQSLSLFHIPVTKLAGLPPGLQSLDLSDTQIDKLEGLPHGLQRLGLYENRYLNSLEGLPRGLRFLSLDCYPSITRLPALPRGLQSLDLHSCTYITSLENLPPGLQSLSIEKSGITKLENLPAGLQSLRLPWMGNIADLAGLPPGLKNLELSFNIDVKSLPPLPPALQSLDLCGTGIDSIPELPLGLRTLELCGVGLELHDLAGLPSGLQSLNLSEAKIDTKNLGVLPSGLRSLDLRVWKTSGIYSLKGLPLQLEKLVLCRRQVRTLKGLPASVKILQFVPCL